MGRRKAGGYIFIWYKNDHGHHVHVHKDGQFLGKVDLGSGRPDRTMRNFGDIRAAMVQARLLKEEDEG